MRAASQKEGTEKKTDQSQTVSTRRAPIRGGGGKAQGPHLKPKVRRVREAEDPGGGWGLPPPWAERGGAGRQRGGGQDRCR